ncbi:hypothetical protein GQ457_18G010210 [Hibiscus cannabinus]
MQIASLGEARRQGDQGINFCSSMILWLWPGRGGYICWYQSLGYAIIEKIKAPIAIYYHWKIFAMARPRRGVRGGGQAPVHLDEVEMEQGNEETLPPLPPVGGEANEGGAIHTRSYEESRPCVNCVNTYRVPRRDAFDHLICYSFLKSYVR